MVMTNLFEKYYVMKDKADNLIISNSNELNVMYLIVCIYVCMHA